MLSEALSLHQKGDLSNARTLYMSILDKEPDNHEALHLLGVLNLQSGDPLAAETLIAKAIATNPKAEIYYGNRANALRQLQRIDDALACLETAIALFPNYPESHYNKGILLAEQKQHAAAIAAFERATAINPRHAEAHYNKGNALLQQKEYQAAIVCYDAAIATRPNYAKAFYNKGNAWRELKNDAAAVTCFTQAIALDPGYAKAYYNRGNALQALKRYTEAVSDYDRCITIRPDELVLVNKGNALLSQHRYSSAIEAYDQAISANPAVAAYHNNKGNAWLGLHRPEHAIDAYQQALQVDPLEKDAHFNQAICYLLTGDLQRGFAKYEWRWHTEDMARYAPKFAQPRWRGQESLQGKRILLHCEQGLGDTIQFARYAKQVAQLGAHVILVVQPPLLELMKRLDGGGELVADGSPLPPFDYHCPLLSLPHAFGTRLESIPAPSRYIFPEQAKVDLWRRKLGAQTRPRIGLRIGLAWSGRPEHKNDENRSITLAQLLKALPEGADLICLQKDIRERDRATLAARPDIRFFGDELKDFSDTAALCESMDLVISVDTSVAHLAGALGKPTWVLLPFVPDWRWLLEREDSPWYPGMRLFRQTAAGDWNGVFATLHAALAKAAVNAEPAGRSEAIRTENGRMPVLMNWQAASNFGWGLLGLNLFLSWADDPQLQPLMGQTLNPTHLAMIDPQRLHDAQPAIAISNQFAEKFHGDKAALHFSFPVIDPLGNGLKPHNEWRGSKTIARCIFEDTNLQQLDRKLAKYDCLLSASHWNARLLSEAAKRPVEMIFEGIDHTLFCPGPKAGQLDPNRFYVFSGGKIEFRKAQDLVLKAFAVFAARHPDAVLVTAWQSPFWKNSIGFKGTLKAELQAKPEGKGVDIVRWACENGIAGGQIIDIGNIRNQAMPQVLREMDCALQVSRAEACTNLPAKEAMACGIPVILAKNTGVLDLIDDGNCLPLHDQQPVSAALANCGADGWGESNVDEIVDALERLYTDTQLRKTIGRTGAAWIPANGRTWHEHARRLKALLLQ
jgi:tetratricopeptide (TPR) repeat protein/glycosyltransferase involved in cell wall biosynthesis